MKWRLIETVPFGATVLVWNPIWRQPFVGTINGPDGMCWIDGHNGGRQDYNAMFWCVIPALPEVDGQMHHA